MIRAFHVTASRRLCAALQRLQCGAKPGFGLRKDPPITDDGFITREFVSDLMIYRQQTTLDSDRRYWLTSSVSSKNASSKYLVRRFWCAHSDRYFQSG